ncbi:MAG: hypothetical protein IT449_05405 [Phycisphaerales bacterium]|nr:hypothetical protein [Phycisphaerales bacterium]
MKKNAVHPGGTYTAKVSGKIVRVRIDAESPYGGWNATNLGTGKAIRVKSAQRLRSAVGEAAPTVKDIVRGLHTDTSSAKATIDRQAKTEDAAKVRAYDPDRCGTPRCKGEPALTYLGKPLCQKCWERHCAEERPSEMVTEGAVPLAETPAEVAVPFAEALAKSEIGAANKASWEQAMPAPDDVNEDDDEEDDERDDAGEAPANTGDAGESETEDMATKTKKNVIKKGKARTAVTKAPTTRKPKTDAKVEAPATRKAKAATNGDAKPTRVSAIDAAAVILKAKGEPMRSREIIEAAAAKGLWSSPAGKTPHATLDAAMRREINTKGKDARFTIEGRGLFGFNAKASA